MDPNQYQQYADFYWHNYTESAALPWDYPPPMHQTYSYPCDSRGSLPGAGARRANTKEVVVEDSLTDSDSEKHLWLDRGSTYLNYLLIKLVFMVLRY